MDLKINIDGTHHILWIVDVFSRFVKGVAIKTKSTVEVLKGILNAWFYNVGPPSTGIWSDNGGEFCSNEMIKFCKVWNIKFSTGAPYSPWQNGLNERNHATCDKIFKKLMMESPKENIQELINQASYIHNTNLAAHGSVPITVMSGRPPKFPLFHKEGDNIEDLDIAENIDKVRNIQKCFLEVEIEKLIKDCSKSHVPGFKHENLETGDRVLVQFDESKTPY